MPADLRIGLIPLAICTWYWLEASSMRYELTSTNLISYSGVFTTEIEKLPLGEIKRFVVFQPWYLRLFSLGTVLLVVDETSDTQPGIVGISNPESLIRRIRMATKISDSLPSAA
ncbi:hypothetical protein D9M68_957630 [compost metagenome]